jgi:hypothetical protein
LTQTDQRASERFGSIDVSLEGVRKFLNENAQTWEARSAAEREQLIARLDVWFNEARQKHYATLNLLRALRWIAVSLIVVAVLALAKLLF